MVDIAVDAQATDVEPVNLGTSSYEFAFPKVAPLLNAQTRAGRIQDKDERGLVMLAAQERWLELGFGPSQWAHIKARTEDEADPLDFRHIQAMFEALFEKAVADRPPTWRGDSSRVSPQAFKREVEPGPLGLMPDPSLLLDSATS